MHYHLPYVPVFSHSYPNSQVPLSNYVTFLAPTDLDEENSKIIDFPTVTNECYSTSRRPSPTRPCGHQQQDLELTQNLTTDAIPTVTNECYSTSRRPSPTRPCGHQQQDMQLTQNLSTDAIPTVTNECYSTSRLPSPTHPPVHQQQDIQLTQNQAYITSANITVMTNECYGTTSMDSAHLYATVEGEHSITHTSQQPVVEDYDYVIP